MGIVDQVREKVDKAEQKDQESAGGKSKQSNANEPDPGQGAGDAEQAPNPTKAAEDVD